MKNTLKLTLKKEWFDLIKAGKKTEEYREIKNYWTVRFLDKEGAKIVNNLHNKISIELK